MPYKQLSPRGGLLEPARPEGVVGLLWGVAKLPEREVRVCLGRRGRDLQVYSHPCANIWPDALDLPDALGLQEPFPHHSRLSISSNKE